MANNGMRNIWNDRKREDERLEKLRRKKQSVRNETSEELIAEKTAAESGPSDTEKK